MVMKTLIIITFLLVGIGLQSQSIEENRKYAIKDWQRQMNTDFDSAFLEPHFNADTFIVDWHELIESPNMKPAQWYCDDFIVGMTPEEIANMFNLFGIRYFKFVRYNKEKVLIDYCVLELQTQ
jgi:hypothetical protein